MADAKPFKVTGGEGTKQTAEETAAPKPGVGIVNAKKSGQPLATPAQSVARAHGHSPEIPWPAAVAIDEVRESHKDGSAHKVSTVSRRPFKV